MKALRTNSVILISIFLMLLAIYGASAASAPNAPQTLTRGASSTFDESNYAPQQTDALAGNITAVNLKAISQTRAWQGYFGNVSGYITLDDANNYTFYNWSAAEPRGEIYANDILDGGWTPDWPNVVCAWGAGTNNAPLNFQSRYGIQQDDYDNVTITYNVTSHPSFEIIDRTITGCPTTYIWRDDNYQTEDFANLLMFDSTRDQNDSWIFTTIIENKDLSNKTDISCYNGELCDFQLLVGEDGHGTDTSTRPYYFWVNLVG